MLQFNLFVVALYLFNPSQKIDIPVPPVVMEALRKHQIPSGCHDMRIIRHTKDGDAEESRIRTFISENGVLQTNYGDKSGVHQRERNEYQQSGVDVDDVSQWDTRLISHEPHHVLLHENRWWSKKGRGPSARVGNGLSFHDRYFDPATCGVFPCWGSENECSGGLPSTILREIIFDPLTRKQIDDYTYQVEYISPANDDLAGSVEWILSPSGHVIEARFLQNGDVKYWSTSDYEDTPTGPRLARVNYFSKGKEDDPHYLSVILEGHQPFGDTCEEPAFTPETIGIGLGHNIRDRDTAEPVLTWDGTKLITIEESQELIYLWGMRRHPDFDEYLKRSSKRDDASYEQRYYTDQINIFRTKYPEKWAIISKQLNDDKRQRDPWDEYVHGVIKKEKLTGEHRDEAIAILDSNKAIRSALRARKVKLAERQTSKEGEQQAGTNPPMATPADGKETKPAGSIRKPDRAEDVDRKIEEVFEKRLKPGIERIVKKVRRDTEANEKKETGDAAPEEKPETSESTEN